MNFILTAAGFLLCGALLFRASNRSDMVDVVGLVWLLIVQILWLGRANFLEHMRRENMRMAAHLSKHILGKPETK